MNIDAKKIETIIKKAKDIVKSSLIETSEGVYLPMNDYRYQLLHRDLYTTTQVQVKEGGVDYMVAVECKHTPSLVNDNSGLTVICISEKITPCSLNTESTKEENK